MKPLLVVGMIGMIHPNGDESHPKALAIGMGFIPMDGGCLPHWDEALDQSTGIIEAVYFASYLYGARSAPYNYSAKYTASITPVDSSKASSQWGKQLPSIGMNLIPMARGLGMRFIPMTNKGLRNW